MYINNFVRIMMLVLTTMFFGTIIFGQGRPTSPGAIAKNFVADKESAEKNCVWTTVTTTIPHNYKTGEVDDSEITVVDCEHTFFNDRLRHRCVPHGQAMTGGFEPDGDSFSFNSSIIDQFTFLDMYHDESGKYNVISFRASSNPNRKITINKKILFFTAKADITNLINTILGDVEVWDNGKIKGARLRLPEKVKISFDFGSGEILIFNADITTQEVDGRTLFKTIEFEYKMHGSALLVLKRAVHKVVKIEYKNYRAMTMVEKSDYLTKTNGWGKVNKLSKADN